MSPLGLFMTTLGALGGNHPTHEAVVIEDYWWEIHRTAGAGYLTPVWDNTTPIAGTHDTWSLHPATSAQGFYSPKSIATISEEGFWEIGTISITNDSVKPLDV